MATVKKPLRVKKIPSESQVILVQVAARKCHRCDLQQDAIATAGQRRLKKKRRDFNLRDLHSCTIIVFAPIS